MPQQLQSLSFVHTQTVRIFIRKVPPREQLEGIDVRHYEFCEGNVYEVGERLAELLIVEGYAQRDRRREPRPKP